MRDIERHHEHLPLAPLVHTVMVALADANLNCYEIAERIALDSDGHISVRPNEIAQTILKMKATDLVADSALQPEPDNLDDLRRCYSLTVRGMRLASAETQRLARLIYAACEKKLVDPATLSPLSRSTSGSYRL